MSNIDIGDMKVFVNVVEAGSISAAAQQLGHLQSNVTVKIKKIEHHYDTELLLRRSKGVVTTQAGQTIYHQYKKLLLLWEETENSLPLKQKKVLRFGITAPIRGNHVSALMQEMYIHYPQLIPTIKTGFTRILEKEIEEGDIDIGFLFGDAVNKNLHYYPNGEEQLVLVGKHIRPTLPETLANNNMLCLSDQSCYLDVLKRLYEELHIVQTEYIQISEMEELINLSQVGLGISLIPKNLIHQYQVQHYMVLEGKMSRSMKSYIVTRKQYQLSVMERSFIALVKSKSLL